MAQKSFWELLIQSYSTIFEYITSVFTYEQKQSYKHLGTAFSSVGISMFS